MKKIFAALILSGIVVLPGCLFERPLVGVPEEKLFAPEDEPIPLSGTSSDTEIKDEANIIVESPTPGELLSSPFEIRGRARVFEGAVNVDIKREDGSVFVSEVALVRGGEAGEYGNFSLNLSVVLSSTRRGIIEVYSLSPKDGSKENLIMIPVEFQVLDQK